MDLYGWILISVLLAVEGGRLLAALLRPDPGVAVNAGERTTCDSPEFFQLLGAHTDSPADRSADIRAHVNGEAFYQAQLDAIRGASETIHLAAYIFRPGPTSARFIKALEAKSRQGVEVRVLLDAFGSLRSRRRHFKRLTDGGGVLEWYHPLRWHTWPRINHRNHQNILIVDGVRAFVGGAGVAECWTPRPSKPAWRDSVFELEGSAVAGLQAAFAENWLEARGELLARRADYPLNQTATGHPTLVVASSPTRGGSTRARTLFQSLIHSAQVRIWITTPYFLPDASARREMIRAMERGVDLHVLVPGRHAVPFMTRRCSRRHYGELLAAGARIHEYQPAMMHAKTMVVDGCWSVFGSTNFDPRSFGINDEINAAVHSAETAALLEEHFRADLENALPIAFDDWKRRPLWERASERLSAVFERQQ